LRAPSEELPVPLSEFERVQLFRRIEAGLAGSPPSRWPSRATWLAAGLGLLVGLALGWRAEHSRHEPATVVATSDPAPRVLELPDGSRASLSAAAELRVDAAEHTLIHLTLLAGRADFQLAGGTGREFVVRAGDAEIKGLGRALSVGIESAMASTAKAVEVQATDGPVDVQRGANDGVITLGSGESWSGRFF
jgi:ferric-dicitrate binding protein FerR (iron transport regulator)